MTKRDTKRHYTPSAKQQALNKLYAHISEYTTLIEADDKQTIAKLIRLCFSRGVKVQDIVEACKTTKTSFYKEFPEIKKSL